jgi:hypothetical protein
MGDGVFEMNDVAILPTWRHLGYGKKATRLLQGKGD